MQSTPQSTLPSTPHPAPWLGAARLCAPLLCAALALACNPAEDGAAGAPAAGGPPNVVLVLVDTVRADHLGTYGHHRDASPFLDRLAAGGAVFENARAQASCTYPSANSLLTSRDPSAFLGRPAGDIGIPEDVPTLAEMLQARGYTTVAVSASPIVRATPSDVNLTGGFGQGFDVFHEDCLWLDASCVKEAALESLLGPGPETPPADPAPPSPYFLFLHYMDPHDPYKPPPRATPRFSDGGEGHPEWVRGGNPNPIAEMLYGEGADDLEFTTADLDHLKALYDDEIAWFDRQLEELLAELERRGVLENTLLMVVSDHGESFYEAGHVKHCRTLDDREIRTPLILHGAGVDGPRRVDRAVANLDVVPTVLEAVDRHRGGAAGEGPPPEPPFLEGHSLWRYLDEDPGDPGPRVIFSSIGLLRAAVDDRYKLVHDLESGSWRLHDLQADPEETTDLLAADDVAADHRQAYRRLRSALEAWLEASKAGDAEAGREMQRKLKALGYLQ